MQVHEKGSMPTLEDRVRGFQMGLEQLQQRYGMRLQVQTQAEQLGETTLVKPIIQVLPISDWQPVEVMPAPHSNGAVEPVEA